MSPRAIAIAFDFGHTLMDEERDRDVSLAIRPVHLMPGVRDALTQLTLPAAVWANTRTAREADVREWLRRAGIAASFRWVVTSVDAGARKPAPAFFRFALAQCGLERDDVLFVGNQLNSDIAGAAAYGIRSVWLSDPAYRSADDRPTDVRPTYTIATLQDLPALLHLAESAE